MIEAYKILHSIYDTTVSPCLPCCHFSATMEKFKLVKHYSKILFHSKSY